MTYHEMTTIRKAPTEINGFLKFVDRYWCPVCDFCFFINEDGSHNVINHGDRSVTHVCTMYRGVNVEIAATKRDYLAPFRRFFDRGIDDIH